MPASWRLSSLLRFSFGICGQGIAIRPARGSRLTWARTLATCRQHQSKSEASFKAHQPQPPRFYVAEKLACKLPGWLCLLDAGETRHTKSLRLQEGAQLELCDGNGTVVLAEVVSFGRDGTQARTVADPVQVARTGWQWQAAVACGTLKGGRADWLVEKCVELGAADFFPLQTQRSSVIGSSSGTGPLQRKEWRSKKGRSGSMECEDGDLDGWQEGYSGSGREGRWQRLATAALKQSLRAHAMRVHVPQDIQALCRRIREVDVALVGVAGAEPLHQVAAAVQSSLHPTDAARAGIWAECSADLNSPSSQSGVTASWEQQPEQQCQSAGLRYGLLVVGPEGDFTPAEIEQLVEAGAVAVGLGDLRLRVETAAIALLAYMQLHFAGYK